MDALTAFGPIAVTGMLVCYAYEGRSPWFTLACTELIHIAGIARGYLAVRSVASHEEYDKIDAETV